MRYYLSPWRPARLSGAWHTPSMPSRFWSSTRIGTYNSSARIFYVHKRRWASQVLVLSQDQMPRSESGTPVTLDKLNDTSYFADNDGPKTEPIDTKRTWYGLKKRHLEGGTGTTRPVPQVKVRFYCWCLLERPNSHRSSQSTTPNLVCSSIMEACPTEANIHKARRAHCAQPTWSNYSELNACFQSLWKCILLRWSSRFLACISTSVFLHAGNRW